jgi:hypothetical protein
VELVVQEITAELVELAALAIMVTLVVSAAQVTTALSVILADLGVQEIMVGLHLMFHQFLV